MGVTVDKILSKPLLHKHKEADISDLGSYVQKSGDTMTGPLTLPGDPAQSLHASTKQYVDNNKYSPLIDTRENILATTPTSGRIAYATDVKSFYVADGTNWRRASLKLETDAQAPDIGYEKDNPKDGYHADWITDKNLHNIAIKGSARTENGGLRIDVTQDPDTFEVYLRNAWQTLIYDLTTENSDFRHIPLSEEIYIWRGDSVKVGLNGRPIIQEYNVSMGAYPPPRLLYGGTF